MDYLINGFICGLVGAITYHLLWARDSHLNKKILALKAYTRRLEVKLSICERLNEEWEIAWLERLGYKREKEKRRNNIIGDFRLVQTNHQIVENHLVCKVRP